MQSGDIASAHARLASDSLTLDLANSIPETDVSLTKQDLGELTAVAVAADGKTVLAKLGTFGYDRYNREAYDATAGIVVLKVDAGAAQIAKSADIQLRKADGTVLLAETGLRAMPNTPNLYLDEGETRITGSDGPRSRCACGSRHQRGNDRFHQLSRRIGDGQTDAKGIATFPLSGTAGQVEGYALLPGGETLGAQFDPQVNTYVYVRTRPSDDNIARLPPTWDNVQKFVLRNWQAMAPCMDNWLDLGDPQQIKSYAAMLRRLTDKTNFEAFRFMPVTRDMTKGQRTLLYAFLDGAPPSALAAAAAPSHRSITELSRAMRGG